MYSETEPSILLGFDHQLLIYPMNFMLPFLPIATNHGTNLVAHSFCDIETHVPLFHCLKSIFLPDIV